MLYHPKVGIPAAVRVPRGVHKLFVTVHARKEAAKDGMTIPAEVDAAQGELFELETDEKGKTVKVGMRFPYDHRDLCMVFRTEKREWVVVTAWANLATDTHTTLKSGRYATVG